MKASIPAKDVQSGMVVWAHGYKWRVRENRFDPYGNTGNQPRHILVCDAAGDNQGLPSAYAHDMPLGYLPDAVVTLVEGDAVLA